MDPSEIKNPLYDHASLVQARLKLGIAENKLGTPSKEVRALATKIYAATREAAEASAKGGESTAGSAVVLRDDDPGLPLLQIHSSLGNSSGQFVVKVGTPKAARDQTAEEVAATYFHVTSGLKPAQLEVVEAARAGRDCFALLPTGFGKSLCYQLASVMDRPKRSISVVITPLLSLIEDQLESFNGLDSSRFYARSLKSSDSSEYCREVMSELICIADGADKGQEEEETEEKKDLPRLKLLYVTVERLVCDRMLQNVLVKIDEKNLLARFVIDEAHCIESWGSSFRPKYLEMCDLIRSAFSTSIMCLTGSATQVVCSEVMEKLGMAHDTLVVKESLDRPNIFLSVVNKGTSRESVDEQVTSFVSSEADACRSLSQPLCGIIYCSLIDDVKRVSSVLNDFFADKSMLHLTADVYHSKLSPEDKKAKQTAWMAGQVHVMVATIAFGMGINKPNVGFVLNYSIPTTISELYQMAGRAGRDGRDAKHVILFLNKDVSKQRRLIIYSEKKRAVVGGGDGEDVQKFEEVVAYCRTHACRRSYLLEKLESSSSAVSRGTACCDICARAAGSGGGGGGEGGEGGGEVVNDSSPAPRPIPDLSQIEEEIEGGGGDTDACDFLALLNAHPHDQHIRFDEGPHEYFVDAEKYDLSVTGLWRRYFSADQFNAAMIIRRHMAKWEVDESSKYFGLMQYLRINKNIDTRTPHGRAQIVEEISEVWALNYKTAGEDGKYMHRLLERYFNNHELGEELEDTCVQQCLEFFRANPWLKPFRTEWAIFDPASRVAGQIDLLCQDERNGEFVMIDYKRTKALKMKDKNHKGTGPCAVLDDTNFWHYAVQQNAYRYILKNNYGIFVHKMLLLQAHPTIAAHKAVNVPVRDDVIDEIFRLRREEVVQTQHAK